MRNIEKIKKQNSLSSKLLIKTGLRVICIGLIIGLICTCGVSFHAAVIVFLGYKLLRLVFRFLGLIIALVYTFICIGITIIIILLLMF